MARVRAWLVAAMVILIWGITFANTRSLLGDFSALVILVVRFALAWAALAVGFFENAERTPRLRIHAERTPRPRIHAERTPRLRFCAAGMRSMMFLTFVEK